MSKDEITTPGLLSKMVKFVRHPATSWNDLDSASEDKGSEYSKQALKEMIERKRRNDFVRKREFDMLRKLRTRMHAPEQGYGGRPSFFQSSYSSKPDDRAGTLKKIDEIEAQMSQQWWKTKQRDSRAGNQSTQPPEAIDTMRAYRSTLPNDQGFAPTTTNPTQSFETPAEGRILRSPPLPVHAAHASGFGGPPSQKGLNGNGPLSGFGPSGSMDLDDAKEAGSFSASKYYALDVQEVALDPEIEEAAIRFASGDDASAEQGLLDVLVRKEAKGTTDEWMALFDLYRATGQMESFESRAIDFANRFSRSAPQWYAMADEVARRTARVFKPSANLSRAGWVAESEVDAYAVSVLQRLLDRTPQPWVIDWNALKLIQADALPTLNGLFQTWGSQRSADLRFVGARNLRDVLQQQTPSGDRSVPRLLWELRLAALRVMNQGDEFELAALDYCVTYEVSPPGWEPPRCHYKSVLNADEGAVPDTGQAMRRVFQDSSPSTMSPALEDTRSDMMGTVGFMAVPEGELMGEVLGDPQALLDSLSEKLKGQQVLQVSCRCLIRVDFSAAGAILNWASAHQAQGRQVHFTQVHRLVSAFFHVIGITEFAKVETKND